VKQCDIDHGAVPALSSQSFHDNSSITFTVLLNRCSGRVLLKFIEELSNNHNKNVITRSMVFWFFTGDTRNSSFCIFDISMFVTLSKIFSLDLSITGSHCIDPFDLWEWASGCSRGQYAMSSMYASYCILWWYVLSAYKIWLLLLAVGPYVTYTPLPTAGRSIIHIWFASTGRVGPRSTPKAYGPVTCPPPIITGSEPPQ